jgi:hypothetical protein
MAFKTAAAPPPAMTASSPSSDKDSPASARQPSA